MVLKIADKWVWDFWFAQNGADYHIFYLQANKSLQDDELRHWNVSVGHAVSQDLRTWEILPDALRPSDNEDAWDNKTTWTGSIIQHEDVWYMFYTGSRHADEGLIQRVGLATSPDLITWTRYGQYPLIEANSQWYEKLSLDIWQDEAWRDPYVFKHPETEHFHAFITGRNKDGEPDGRGVIAHATSPDLKNWSVQPPVTTPGEFGQMEVPQLVQIGDKYYLLFCTNGHHFSKQRQARGIPPETGTHYLIGDNPLGPFRYLEDKFLVGDEDGTLYSGKLIQGPDEQWYFMGFHNFVDGNFIGEIADPMLVTIADDGRLSVG